MPQTFHRKSAFLHHNNFQCSSYHLVDALVPCSMIVQRFRCVRIHQDWMCSYLLPTTFKCSVNHHAYILLLGGTRPKLLTRGNGTTRKALLGPYIQDSPTVHSYAIWTVAPTNIDYSSFRFYVVSCIM